MYNLDNQEQGFHKLEYDIRFHTTAACAAPAKIRSSLESTD